MKTLRSLLAAFCVRHYVMAANDAPAEDIFAVNEAAYGVDDTGVMVVPFGEVPVMVSMNGRKVRGLQRIDATAGNEMAADMTGIMGMLKNAFIGRPIFLGHPYHPDATEAAKYPDKRARGFIKSVEVANETIRLMPKYNKLGSEEVTDQQMIFHSPQWRMKPVMAANGQQEVKDGMPVFRPYSLHSGGLTNNPNIPVPPLMGANEEAANAVPSIDVTKILTALTESGVIQAGDDELTILRGIANLKDMIQWSRERKAGDARELERLRTVLPSAANEATREELFESLLKQSEAHAANEAQISAANESLKTKNDELESRFTAARTAHVNAALKPLIATNKIPGAQIDAVRTELISAANEADIDTRLQELASTKPRLGTTGGVTDDIKPGAMKIVMAANESSARSRQRNEAVSDCLQEITQGRKAKPGDQEKAWNLAQSRNPALFAR
jgi:hypothetical protein